MIEKGGGSWILLWYLSENNFLKKLEKKNWGNNNLFKTRLNQYIIVKANESLIPWNFINHFQEGELNIYLLFFDTVFEKIWF